MIMIMITGFVALRRLGKRPDIWFQFVCLRCALHIIGLTIFISTPQRLLDANRASDPSFLLVVDLRRASRRTTSASMMILLGQSILDLSYTSHSRCQRCLSRVACGAAALVHAQE